MANIGQLRASSFYVSPDDRVIDLKQLYDKKEYTIGSGEKKSVVITSSFTATENYYLFVSIKRLSDDQNIKVKLLNNKDNEYLQVQELYIPSSSENNAYFNVEIAFRPIRGEWDKIVFEPTDETTTPIFEENSLELDLVKNLIEEDSVIKENIIQLGIQAEPGFLFIMNGEPIRVGRTGIYELMDSYTITNLGLIPKRDKDEPSISKDYFLLDYKTM